MAQNSICSWRVFALSGPDPKNKFQLKILLYAGIWPISELKKGLVTVLLWLVKFQLRVEFNAEISSSGWLQADKYFPKYLSSNPSEQIYSNLITEATFSLQNKISIIQNFRRNFQIVLLKKKRLKTIKNF